MLQQQISDFNAAGVKEIIVSVDGDSRTSDLPGAKVLTNGTETHGAELSQLMAARETLEGTVVVCPDGLLLKQHVLFRLLKEPGDVVLVVDSSAGTTLAQRSVRCTARYSRDFFADSPRLTGFGASQPHGEWIGAMKLGPDARESG